MATPADRTMFEIYREAGYGRQYRVVYFTELDEHNKQQEIDRALAGEHIYDGFLADLRKDAGKAKVADIIRRLNDGEKLDATAIEAQLEGLMG